MNTKPKRLNIRIDHYMVSSFSLKLEAGELQYARDIGCEMQFISASDEQWAAFRQELDSIGIWQWKSKYDNPGVCDGTGWEINIAYADKMIRSSGINAYPDRNGACIDGGGTFIRFCKAVQSLTGGLDFE